MSYQQCSIREAIEKINVTWFLPNTQRPYVWGSRYESEMYICRLFDSLLRGYPIGTLLIWETGKTIPYREFLKDYDEGDFPNKSVDNGRWEKSNKGLVYDGQQRLQTLYSCLNYKFNKKTLVFDLLFEMKKQVESNETGFEFVDSRDGLPPNTLRMTEVFSKNKDEKFKFKKDILQRCSSITLTEEQKNLIEENIDQIWHIFVEKEKYSLAYFPITHDDEKMVNEIFQRINSGGIPLSEADLLLSKIKETNSDFEEDLQDFTKTLYQQTGSGYLFDEYSALQFIHLMVKGTTRVDPDKIKARTELNQFVTVWKEMKGAIEEFFTEFLYGTLGVNKEDIIPKKMALYPMIAYFYLNHKKGKKFRQMTDENVLRLKKYFVLSQINDWNLQSIIDESIRKIKEETKVSLDFPLDNLIQIAGEKRKITLSESDFISYRWLSLKILTPKRFYRFNPESSGRLNPQIDHIYPRKLRNQNETYYKSVDIIWNMQPVRAEINNFKRRRHPKEFFTSGEGKKYIGEYDYLPSTNLDDAIWGEPLEFISKRRQQMLKFLKDSYDIELTQDMVKTIS